MIDNLSNLLSMEVYNLFTITSLDLNIQKTNLWKLKVNWENGWFVGTLRFENLNLSIISIVGFCDSDSRHWQQERSVKRLKEVTNVFVPIWAHLFIVMQSNHIDGLGVKTDKWGPIPKNKHTIANLTLLI